MTSIVPTLAEIEERGFIDGSEMMGKDTLFLSSLGTKKQRDAYEKGYARGIREHFFPTN